MDEIVHRLQGYLKKIALDRLGSLPMWMGVAGLSRLTQRMPTDVSNERQRTSEKDLAVAKVIEFYQPLNFRKPVRWIPPAERGKLLEFRVPEQKSA